MASYSLSMDCPHSTFPDVLWLVRVHDQQGTESYRCVEGDERLHCLFVPPLHTWTLDTLRMTLHELAAYLPPGDVVIAGVEAKPRRRSGRQSGTNLRPSISPVTLWVETRGWRAELWTWLNEKTVKDGERPPLPGEWTDPMIVALLELVERSPFPLDRVAPVKPGDPAVHNIWPSRLMIQLGVDEPAAQGKSKVSPTMARALEKFRDAIDDLLDD